jgi:hypothetical protein
VDDGITIFGPDALPEEWLARIKPELAPGERLIWAGQAKPPRGPSGRTAATIWASGFAAIGAFGFAGLFGMLGPRLSEASGLMALLGVGASSFAFLIVVGLVSQVLASGVDYTPLRSSLYVLTDSRAIAWTPSGPGVTVQSTRRGAVRSLHRVEYADGSGNVVFDNLPPSPSGLPAGFRNIPDARRVEALARLHLIGDDPSRPAP